jgi:hypothetical protein
MTFSFQSCQSDDWLQKSWLEKTTRGRRPSCWKFTPPLHTTIPCTPTLTVAGTSPCRRIARSFFETRRPIVNLVVGHSDNSTVCESDSRFPPCPFQC